MRQVRVMQVRQPQVRLIQNSKETCRHGYCIYSPHIGREQSSSSLRVYHPMTRPQLARPYSPAFCRDSVGKVNQREGLEPLLFSASLLTSAADGCHEWIIVAVCQAIGDGPCRGRELRSRCLSFCAELLRAEGGWWLDDLIRGCFKESC
jgi:hypothetical protein